MYLKSRRKHFKTGGLERIGRENNAECFGASCTILQMWFWDFFNNIYTFSYGTIFGNE